MPHSAPTAREAMVRDLDSRNGILVNGAKTKRSAPHHGDVVQIGHLQVKYVDEVGPFTDVPAADAARDQADLACADADRRRP